MEALDCWVRHLNPAQEAAGSLKDSVRERGNVTKLCFRKISLTAPGNIGLEPEDTGDQRLLQNFRGGGGGGGGNEACVGKAGRHRRRLKSRCSSHHCCCKDFFDC